MYEYVWLGGQSVHSSVLFYSCYYNAQHSTCAPSISALSMRLHVVHSLSHLFPRGEIMFAFFFALCLCKGRLVGELCLALTAEGQEGCDGP